MDKCGWATSKLKYLGFIKLSEGIHPDKEKVEVFEKIQFPIH
jgi:hypothetical protein